jgi:hypothetical protein
VLLAAASEERGFGVDVCSCVGGITTAIVSSLLLRLQLPTWTRARAAAAHTEREREWGLVMCVCVCVLDGLTTAVLSDRRALETFWPRNAPILFAPQRILGFSLDTSTTKLFLSSEQARILLKD